MSDSGPYSLSNEQTVFSGRWLATKQVDFKCPNGTQGVWQSAHRTTRPASAPVDGVNVIPLLVRDGRRYFVFIKQYRIPMRGYCLEFPAGLIDEGETVEEAALRELREETGYVATKENVIHRTCGKQPMDPGLTDDTAQFVTVQIDGNLPLNQNPTQKLDGSEDIEVVLVECDRVLDYFRSIEKDIHIEAQLYTFAIGISFSQHFQGK